MQDGGNECPASSIPILFASKWISAGNKEPVTVGHPRVPFLPFDTLDSNTEIRKNTVCSQKIGIFKWSYFKCMVHLISQTFRENFVFLWSLELFLEGKNPKCWETPTMYKGVQKHLLHKHSDPVVSLLLTHSIWVDSTGRKTSDSKLHFLKITLVIITVVWRGQYMFLPKQGNSFCLVLLRQTYYTWLALGNAFRVNFQVFEHAHASGFCGCCFYSVFALSFPLGNCFILGSVITDVGLDHFPLLRFKGGGYFFNVQYLFNLLCFVKHHEIYGVSGVFPPFKNSGVLQRREQLPWLTHWE